MVFERLFGRSVSETDFIELDTSAVETPSGKVPIRVSSLEDFSDTDKIQRHLRDGSIVFVKIKKLKEKDMSELKRAIDKLRKTCLAVNGDIAGIDENYIVCTPSYAHIARE